MVTLVLFYVWSAVRFIKMDAKRLLANPLWLAAVFVGVPYLHHVFSRGDVPHLSEGIFPLLAGIAALSNRKLGAWLILFTLLGALPLTNLFFKAFVRPESMTFYRVGPDRMWVFKTDVYLADNYKKLIAEQVPANEKLFLAPICSTLYCILGRTSPTYSTFFFRPGTEKQQKRTIRELESVNWAVISDVALDGRVDLRFSNAQGLVTEYLMSHFDAIPVVGFPDEHYFLRRSLKES